jgi:serine/threonine protein kinase
MTLESLARQNLDECVVAQLTRDMLEALEHLHRHNCIHRDLKLSVLSSLYTEFNYTRTGSSKMGGLFSEILVLRASV